MNKIRKQDLKPSNEPKRAPGDGNKTCPIPIDAKVFQLISFCYRIYSFFKKRCTGLNNKSKEKITPLLDPRANHRKTITSRTFLVVRASASAGQTTLRSSWAH